MPRIIVIADCRTDFGGRVVLEEDVVAVDNDRSAAQLVERVGQGIFHAQEFEQADRDVPVGTSWLPAGERGATISRPDAKQQWP